MYVHVRVHVGIKYFRNFEDAVVAENAYAMCSCLISTLYELPEAKSFRKYKRSIYDSER
jgi:hypothetical protein